jgi:CRISPR-associated protein Cas1
MLRPRGPARPFDFRTRNRRPPRDPVNALLSFAYAILCKDCFSAACTVGFDPYQGFFHAGRHGKPSLALDLMEEFRSVIADSVVLTLVNNASSPTATSSPARRLPAQRLGSQAVSSRSTSSARRPR